jgi:FkbM family methyltransferase
MSVVVNHLGVRLELDPTVISSKMIENIKGGRYENVEAREINRIIQADEVVVEIGAGIGFIASLIAKNDNTRRVVSYEANPKLIGHITKTLENNTSKDRKNWEVRNAILKNGSDEETVPFYVHHDFWASSLLPIKDAESIEQVKVENFNQVLRDIKPTMIVCDIEGGELDLFKNSDLSGVKKVYMEIHQNRLGRRKVRDLFEIFHARDFHYDQHHSHSSVILFSHVDR